MYYLFSAPDQCSCMGSTTGVCIGVGIVVTLLSAVAGLVVWLKKFCEGKEPNISPHYFQKKKKKKKKKITKILTIQLLTILEFSNRVVCQLIYPLINEFAYQLLYHFMALNLDLYPFYICGWSAVYVLLIKLSKCGLCD